MVKMRLRCKSLSWVPGIKERIFSRESEGFLQSMMGLSLWGFFHQLLPLCLRESPNQHIFTLVNDWNFFPVVNEGRHDFQSILESKFLVVDLHEADLMLISIVIYFLQPLKYTIALLAFIRDFCGARNRNVNVSREKNLNEKDVYERRTQIMLKHDTCFVPATETKEEIPGAHNETTRAKWFCLTTHCLMRWCYLKNVRHSEHFLHASQLYLTWALRSRFLYVVWEEILVKEIVSFTGMSLSFPFTD